MNFNYLSYTPLKTFKQGVLFLRTQTQGDYFIYKKLKRHNYLTNLTNFLTFLYIFYIIQR